MGKRSSNTRSTESQGQSECGSEHCRPTPKKRSKANKGTPSNIDTASNRKKLKSVTASNGRTKAPMDAASKKHKPIDAGLAGEKFTKAQLIDSLKNAGVKYNTKAKKAVLLALYNTSTGGPSSPPKGKASKKPPKGKASKKLDSIINALTQGAIAPLPFGETLCNVFDAVKDSSEKAQTDIFRILIQNSDKMYLPDDGDGGAAAWLVLHNCFDEGLAPDTEAMLWCLLVKLKLITCWDELLTEIGHQYPVEVLGNEISFEEAFNRYLDVVDTAAALCKKKLISNFQNGIVTGDDAYKRNGKNRKATFKVISYLLDREDRFDTGTHNQWLRMLREIPKKTLDTDFITDDANNRITQLTKRNSNPAPSATGTKQFYKIKQKNWTKQQLVIQCKKRQLPTTGNKLTLMERCRKFELNYDSEQSEQELNYDSEQSE